MQLYHVVLEQRAAFLTEPTSGVLMGSLAWAYSDLYGEEALAELLAAYPRRIKPGAAPPLICSAALPAGWLPRPHFTYLTPRRTHAVGQSTIWQHRRGGAAPPGSSAERLPRAALAAAGHVARRWSNN